MQIDTFPLQVNRGEVGTTSSYLATSGLAVLGIQLADATTMTATAMTLFVLVSIVSSGAYTLRVGGRRRLRARGWCWLSLSVW